MQEPLVERVKLATHSLQSSGNGPLQCAQFSAHDRHDVVTCFGNVTASVDVVVVVLVVVVVAVSVVVVVLYDELSVAEVLFCDVTVSDDDIMSDPEVVILSACCKVVVVVEVVVDVVVGVVAVVGGDVISVVTLAA